jgi:glycerol uptake facilitator-like aquaporin
MFYIFAQFIGAVLAGALVYLLFASAIVNFETLANIRRGLPGSELSAMMFGEYFPNPSLSGQAKQVLANVIFWDAFFTELVGTALLALVVFVVTKENYISRNLQPVLIGLTVAIIISLLAPITQAGLNPARDFGPRLVSYFAGWRQIAIPAPNYGFLVYIFGPVFGALVGGGLGKLVTSAGLQASAKSWTGNRKLSLRRKVASRPAVASKKILRSR